MLNGAIIDHIEAGNFDRELGRLVRDPKFAEYTSVELKAVLTDRIAANMCTERDLGRTTCWAILGVVCTLAVLVLIIIN